MYLHHGSGRICYISSKANHFPPALLEGSIDNESNSTFQHILKKLFRYIFVKHN